MSWRPPIQFTYKHLSEIMTGTCLLIAAYRAKDKSGRITAASITLIATTILGASGWNTPKGAAKSKENLYQPAINIGITVLAGGTLLFAQEKLNLKAIETVHKTVTLPIICSLCFNGYQLIKSALDIA